MYGERLASLLGYFPSALSTFSKALGLAMYTKLFPPYKRIMYQESINKFSIILLASVYACIHAFISPTWCLQFEYFSILFTALFKIMVKCKEMLPEF